MHPLRATMAMAKQSAPAQQLIAARINYVATNISSVIQPVLRYP